MQVPAAFGRLESRLQQELRSLLQGRNQPLYRMVEYQLGWIDEHGSPTRVLSLPYHAVACVLAGEALGGAEARVLPAAAAVELAYQFVRVHSEIQDGTPNVARRSPVWWVWGPAQAINAGDSLHALARLSLLRLSDKGVPSEVVLDCLARLDRACLHLCEAQYTDLSLQEHLDVGLDAYTQVAQGKNAALLGCAMELGALLADGQAQSVQAFGQAAVRLGLAFHARSEITAFWERPKNEPPPGDLLNKSKTLPFVIAYPTAPPKEKRELGTLYLQRVLAPADIDRIAAILESLGARQKAEEMVHGWTNEALGHLGASGLSADALREVKELFSFLLAEPSLALR